MGEGKRQGNDLRGGCEGCGERGGKGSGKEARELEVLNDLSVWRLLLLLVDNGVNIGWLDGNTTGLF